jgi:hypothetical protein
MIGGIRINVTPQGNVAGMSNKNTRQQQQLQRQTRHSSSSSSEDEEGYPREMDSEDMLDYLQNIGATNDPESDDDDEGNKVDILGTSTGRRRHFEMLRRFGGVEIGDEGAPEDIIGRFYDDDDQEESSSEEEESEDSFSSGSGSEDNGDAHSLSSFSSDDDGEEEEEEDEALSVEEDSMDVDNGAGVLTLEELEQLPTAIRYPVSVRPTPVHVSGAKQGSGPPGGGSKKRNGKNKGGKLAPGEKARLRREKIEAKRAGRAMVRGFDLAGVNKELEKFVIKEQDMHAFPPMPKHECRQVQKLAALYGCKAGAQGSGKKRSVMVLMTERTALPQGDALLEIGRLLTAHTAAELGVRSATTPIIPGLWVGAPRIGGSGGLGGKKGRNSRGTDINMNDDGGGILTGKGRWADFKKKGPRSKSAARKRQEKYDFASTRSMHLRPINFISKGTINPDDDEVEIYQPGQEESENITSEEDKLSEEEGAGPSLLNVFEDRRGGSTAPSSLSSGSSSDGCGDENEESDQIKEVEDDFIIRTTEEEESVRAAKLKEKKKRRHKRKKERRRRRKEAARLQQASGLLAYSSRGADAAEGITNSGRLLGLGMALGIGSQVFNTTTSVQEDTTTTTKATRAIADLSPLEPMLSKTAQKKLAKQKKRGGNTTYPTTTTTRSFVSSPTRAARPPAGLGAGSSTAGVGSAFGDFEAHTTGIGSKLLAKWGFSGAGSGLGRGGTGISEPLPVKMRAKGLGLGADTDDYYGPTAPSFPLPARTKTTVTPPSPTCEMKILRIENPETREVLNLSTIATLKKASAEAIAGTSAAAAAPAQKEQPEVAASKSFKDVDIRPKSEEAAPEPKMAEEPAQECAD